MGNPARWSQKSSMPTTQELLEAVSHDDKERGRPILLRIIENGQIPKEVKYDNVALAVSYLKTFTEDLHPELKPLEDAHADAESRLADATLHVLKAKQRLEDSQAEARAAGALV